MIHLHSNGGYWAATWTDSAGKRRRKSLGSKKSLSKAAARRLIAEMHREHAETPTAKDFKGGMTLGVWRTAYARQRVELKRITLVLHDLTMRALIERFGEDRKLETITRTEAAEWRAWLATRPRKSQRRGRVEYPHEERRDPIGEASIARHVRAAKTIFGHALAQGLVRINPFTFLPGRAPKTKRDYREFTDTELQRVLDACPSADWRALVGLLAFAGLRLNEAFTLAWADIRLEENRLIVRPADRKTTTKARERECLLEPRLARLLLEARESGPPRERVLGLNRESIRGPFQQIIRRAGMTPWRYLFHALRAHRATTWRLTYPEHVVDAWLGHGPEVARQHYVRVSESFYDLSPSVPTATLGETSGERAEIQRLRQRVAELESRGAPNLPQNPEYPGIPES